MKKFLFLFLLLASCSSNNVTEIGSPITSKQKTVVSATLKSVNAAAQGLLGALDTDSVISRDLVRSLGGEETDFDCSFDRDTKTLDCACPLSGRFQIVFSADFEAVAGVVTIDQEGDFTFESCEIAACDDSVVLDGSFSHLLSGQLELISRDGNLTGTSSTESECAGTIYDSDNDYGFDIEQTLDESAASFSGQFCFEDELIIFDTLDELVTAVDPEGTCNDFEP